MPGDPVTLILANVILCTVAAAVWLTGARAFGIAPAAGLRLALVNVLFAGGLVLYSQRDTGHGLPAYWGADVTLLAAFALTRDAVQRLEDVRSTVPETVAVTLGASIALLLMPYTGSLSGHALVFALAAGWLMTRCAIDTRATLRVRVRPLGMVLMVGPLLFVAALLFARAAAVFLLHGHEAQADSPLVADRSLLWSMLLLILIVNVVYAGLVSLQLIARIERLTVRDPLTDVLNRRALRAALADEHLRLRRGQRYSVVMLDIDHFKEINDRHGHACGDAALVHLVATLRDALRSIDLIGRMGGEEFCIVLPLDDEAGAALAAERMRARLGGAPVPWEGGQVPMTASFGVAQARTSDASPDEVLQRADAALYRAKNLGRNRVCTTEDGAPAQTPAR